MIQWISLIIIFYLEKNKINDKLIYRLNGRDQIDSSNPHFAHLPFRLSLSFHPTFLVVSPSCLTVTRVIMEWGFGGIAPVLTIKWLTNYMKEVSFQVGQNNIDGLGERGVKVLEGWAKTKLGKSEVGANTLKAPALPPLVPPPITCSQYFQIIWSRNNSRFQDNFPTF